MGCIQGKPKEINNYLCRWKAKLITLDRITNIFKSSLKPSIEDHATHTGIRRNSVAQEAKTGGLQTQEEFI